MVNVTNGLNQVDVHAELHNTHQATDAAQDAKLTNHESRIKHLEGISPRKGDPGTDGVDGRDGFPSPVGGSDGDVLTKLGSSGKWVPADSFGGSGVEPPLPTPYLGGYYVFVGTSDNPSTTGTNEASTGWMHSSDLPSSGIVNDVAGRYLFRQSIGQWRGQSVVGARFVSAQSSSFLTLTPFWVSTEGTFSSVRLQVSGAASGETTRLGLYKARADGKPDELVRDFGTIDVSSTGMKVINFSAAPVTLNGGTLYHLAHVCKTSNTSSYWGFDTTVLLTDGFNPFDAHSDAVLGVNVGHGTWMLQPKASGGNTVNPVTAAAPFPASLVKLENDSVAANVSGNTWCLQQLGTLTVPTIQMYRSA